jgi:hypothetical protein
MEVREAVSHSEHTSPGLSPISSLSLDGPSTGRPQAFIHSLWTNYTGVIRR